MPTSSLQAPILSFVDTGISTTDAITNNGTIKVSGISGGNSWQYSIDGFNWIRGSGSSFTVTGDGPITVMVQQLDRNGFPSETAYLNFILDTKVSAPQITLSQDTGRSSDGITKDGTVIVSGLETGATWQYSTDSGATWINGVGASFTLTGDGTKSVLVRQTDIAGNISTSANISFILDTMALDPVIRLEQDNGSSSSDGITNNGTLTISALENGGSWEYSIDTGLNWNVGVDPRISLTGDGAKTVLVRQTDLAGNKSRTTSFSYLLDTKVISPVVNLLADTGSSNIDFTTSNGNLSITDQETGATVEYSINDGTNWTKSFSAIEGINKVLVRQTDLAGNSSEATLISFTLDTRAPASLGLSLASDAGSSALDFITNVGSLSIVGLEDGAIVEYLTNSNPTWSQNFTSVEGSNTVYVRQKDLAGNTSSISSLTFLLDTQIPSDVGVSLSSDVGISSSDFISPSGELTLSGLQLGTTVEYSLDDGKNWTTTFSAVEGLNKVLVRQTDLAGNSSNPTLISFTVDTIAPVIPGVSLISDAGTSSSDFITNVGSLSFAGLEDEVIVEYSTDNKLTWSQTFTATEGVNTVYVRQKDLAGNTSLSSSLTFVLDTQKPLDVGVSLASDSGTSATDLISNNAQLTISGIETGAKAEYSVDNGSTWQASFTAAEGLNKVLVRQMDLAGNTSNPTSLTFTLDTFSAVPTVKLTSDSGASSTDSITKNGNLFVSGLETGSKAEYSLDNGSTWQGSFTALEGLNNVHVRQRDLAGNFSERTILNFTLDTKAPMGPSLNLVSDTGASNNDRITSNGAVSVTGFESGASWEYSSNGGSSWSSGIGSTFTLTGDGLKSVLVRQTDLAGNISTNSAMNVTLDTSTPTDIAWMATAPSSQTALPGGALATLAAVDGANKTGFQYTLVNSSSGFTLSSGGALNFVGTSSAPNLGTKTTYNLNIVTQDSAGNAFVKAFSILTGDLNANIMTGSATHEIFYGGDGNDSISSSGGDDIIFAQSGNDTLIGGAGKDRLNGGSGTDTFRFTSASDSSSRLFADTIDDFVTGTDKINLATIDARTSTTADEAFKFVSTARSTVTANSVTWHQDTVNKVTVVQADNTGDTVADFVLCLNGLLNLSSKDFIL